MAAVERFAETERGDIRHLQGDKSGELRLRVGPWRVLFSQAEGEIVVRRVLPRSGALSAVIAIRDHRRLAG